VPAEREHRHEPVDADRLAVQVHDAADRGAAGAAGRGRVHPVLGARVRPRRRGRRGRRARGRAGRCRRERDPVSTEWLGIVLLAVLFAAIFIGFPIAFTLIAVGAIGGWLALGPLALHLMTLQVFSVMRDPTLASVPFFLFMGYLLEQSGLMERLFRGVQLALASIRGSLYLAVLLTATI